MSEKTFEFSKAFIDKMGIGEFCKARNRNFLKTIFMYMIDWRTRKLVNLQHKMRDELRDIKGAYLDSVVYIAKIIQGTCSVTYLEEGYCDQIVYDIERWVKKNITYIPDISIHNTPEYWQNSHETLKLKSGDCEDGSWLIVLIARLCGVPEDMIWLEAGHVSCPHTRGRIEGHAWVKYICEVDGVPRMVDWCYCPTKDKIRYRPFANENVRYLNVWFGVNDKRYFGRYKSNTEEI